MPSLNNPKVKLMQYEPLPCAVPFHASKKPIKILIGGNRSGVTTAACAEFSNRLADLKDTEALVVGRDWRTIAETVARKLPAMVSIRDILWQSKSRKEPSLMTTAFDQKIYFASSEKMPQGMWQTITWADGDIQLSAAKQIIDATILRGGRFIWSLNPYRECHALIKKLRLDPDVDVFRFSIDDNIHLDREAVAKFKANIMDHEDYAMRTEGVFVEPMILRK